jgi:hypothetical protein
MHTIKQTPLWLRLFVVRCILITFALAMTVQAQEGDDFTPIADHPDIVAASEGGWGTMGDDPVAMGDYNLGHGPNVWCARCHSPQNWDPEAFRGPPPSCFSCKFATDDEVRIAPGNPLVEEADWVGIPCATCHVVDGDMINATENAWYNPIMGEYQEVATTTELCEKCHVTTTGNAFGSAVDHKITLGGSAHLNYGGFLGEAAPPTYCTDCHDAHTQQPMVCEDCHQGAGDYEEHNATHLAAIECIACHDASEAEVGPNPDEEDGMWTTVLTSVGRDGTESTASIISHSIVYTVGCDRCHFEGNKYELSILDASGEPPEEESSD